MAMRDTALSARPWRHLSTRQVSRSSYSTTADLVTTPDLRLNWAFTATPAPFDRSLLDAAYALADAWAAAAARVAAAEGERDRTRAELGAQLDAANRELDAALRRGDRAQLEMLERVGGLRRAPPDAGAGALDLLKGTETREPERLEMAF